MPWKLIFDFLFERFVVFTEFIKAFYFFLDDALAFFKHFNLCIKLVHFVFVFEDHILIDISDLELEVFRAHGEREVVFIQELAVEHAICWIQFG